MSQLSRRGLALGLCIAWITSAVLAEPPVRYDNHAAVRVVNKSAEQIAALHALDAVLLSCHEGVGPTDYIVVPERMADLARLGVDYTILNPNIQSAIDAERASIEAAEAAGYDDATWFTNYKNFDAIVSRLQQMVVDRPDLCTLINLGNSHEGRTIWGLRISGSPGAKPALLFNSTQHAREWVSPMVTMWIADRLVYEYGVNTELTALVDSLEFFIVPVVNPDGYVYTWTTNRQWRKNRRNNGSCFGVDNNRNWPAGWGGEGASADQCNDTYRGPSAGSEPETQALMSFYNAHPQIVCSIDFHSYTQLILSPYGYTVNLPPDHDIFVELNAAMETAIEDVYGFNYTAGPIYTTIYPASGGAVDWAYDNQGVFSWTIELRPSSAAGGGFELPAAQIIPCCEENFEAIRVLANWSLSPIKISFPTARPDFVPADLAASIDFKVRAIGDELDPNSVRVQYRVAHQTTFAQAPASPLGAGVYRATLPAAACGKTIEYYFEAATLGGVAGVSPSGAPAAFYTTQAVTITTVVDDNFETDLGWTTSFAGATAGFWQRGVPVNDPSWAYDPISDGDGSGQCWLTQNTAGNSDVDNGSVTLTSPVFDLSAGGQIEYLYYLYLTGTSDALRVEINNAAGVGAWTTIANHTTDGGTTWRSNLITSASIEDLGVALTAAMRVRFTATDANPQTIVEAGLDGFKVRRIACDGPTLCPGDMNCDGVINFGDIDAFVLALGGEAGYAAQFPNCPWLNGDIDGDNTVNFADIDGFVAQIGQNCP